jgi:hypothetical protein
LPISLVLTLVLTLSLARTFAFVTGGTIAIHVTGVVRVTVAVDIAAAFEQAFLSASTAIAAFTATTAATASTTTSATTTTAALTLRAALAECTFGTGRAAWRSRYFDARGRHDVSVRLLTRYANSDCSSNSRFFLTRSLRLALAIAVLPAA